MEIGSKEFIEFTVALARWIKGIANRSEERKAEVRAALRQVVVAVRETSAYIAHLEEGGARSHQRDAQLAATWETLHQELRAVGVNGLAKRCYVKGRIWARDRTLTDEYVARADVKLEAVERLANAALAKVGA